MTEPLCPSALLWLEDILNERFGHVFKLDQNAAGKLFLKRPGDDRFITFLVDSVTFNRTDSDLPCSYWDAAAENWRSALDSPLPAPGADNLPTPLILSIAQGKHIGYDILGLAYWMLNRLEEVGRTDLDRHGRFPATSSHAFKHGYLERPVVDEWLYILGQVIQQVWPDIKLKQHQFSVKVSHDVDSPSLYAFKPWSVVFRMMAGHLLKRRNLRAFVQAPYIKALSRKKIHPTDPFNTFEWIMNISDHYDLTSAFYFICGCTTPLDADYELEDRRIRYLLRYIHARGHEIGLHPSYGTYQKPELIRQEADRLRRLCAEEGIQQDKWGGRMHYLRWTHPATLQAWSDAGMNYDSTLSYADQPGFRCGTCFEYPAFNPVSKQALPLRLRPLVMMEGTVIDDTYLGLGMGQAALDKAQTLKRICKKMNGTFTLLWHNSLFETIEHRDFYHLLIMNESFDKFVIKGV